MSVQKPTSIEAVHRDEIVDGGSQLPAVPILASRSRPSTSAPAAARGAREHPGVAEINVPELNYTRLGAPAKHRDGCASPMRSPGMRVDMRRFGRVPFSVAFCHGIRSLPSSTPKDALLTHAPR